nr:hypothetical protein [Tanacetum cinerariifolium]
MSFIASEAVSATSAAIVGLRDAERSQQLQLISLHPSLVKIIKDGSDEMMHLVLETLQAAVKAGCIYY